MMRTMTMRIMTDRGEYFPRRSLELAGNRRGNLPVMIEACPVGAFGDEK